MNIKKPILFFCDPGGILAYEVANQLLNSCHPVPFLGLIDSYPPDECTSDEDEAETGTEFFLNEILSLPMLIAPFLQFGIGIFISSIVPLI